MKITIYGWSTNRMSPAGIPMFHGADDPDTAVREIVGPAKPGQDWVTYAQFETSRPCRIVDFTQLPDIPPSRKHQVKRPLINVMIIATLGELAW